VEKGGADSRGCQKGMGGSRKRRKKHKKGGKTRGGGESIKKFTEPGKRAASKKVQESGAGNQ